MPPIYAIPQADIEMALAAEIINRGGIANRRDFEPKNSWMWEFASAQFGINQTGPDYETFWYRMGKGGGQSRITTLVNEMLAQQDGPRRALTIGDGTNRTYRDAYIDTGFSVSSKPTILGGEVHHITDDGNEHVPGLFRQYSIVRSTLEARMRASAEVAYADVTVPAGSRARSACVIALDDYGLTLDTVEIMVGAFISAIAAGVAPPQPAVDIVNWVIVNTADMELADRVEAILEDVAP